LPFYLIHDPNTTRIMQRNTTGAASNAPSSLHSQYSTTRLPNGIRIVSEELPYVRSVSVGVWIDSGSRDEREGNNGISHFVEHMVFKGTRRFTAPQIARSLESVGGYLNAFTTKEQTCYYARVLDDHLPNAIDVISDLIQHPIFEKKEIEKERTVILEELKNIEDDPDDLIHDYLDRNVYHNHSLGFPIIGSAENIRRFSQDDLFAYVADRYRTDRMVVAAAGHLNHEELVELVAKYFTQSGTRRKAPQRTEGPRRAQTKRLVYEKPITQAHVCLGTLGYSVLSERRYPLMVLNSLLGEGMSSRLFQNIREKYGFAYSVYSFTNLMSDTGCFGVYIGTDSTHIDDSISLIHKELEKLRSKPIGAAELKRTKAQLKGTMMLGLESMSNRMMRLGSGELYFRAYHSLDQVLTSIDSVSVGDVYGVAEQLFVPEKFSTVIFKPDPERSQAAVPEAA
jgi:predicted Zn-dependent peptidase